MNRLRNVAGQVLGIAVLLMPAAATGHPAVAEDRQKPVKIGVLAKGGVASIPWDHGGAAVTGVCR